MAVKRLTSDDKSKLRAKATTDFQIRMYYFKMLEQGLWFDDSPSSSSPLTQLEAQKWMSQQWYRYLHEEEEFTFNQSKKLTEFFDKLCAVYEIKYGIKFKLLGWEESI
jgi:mannose/cellobiose epimerase-like protein (N-acyl-D-glucosamine 2-epimerase family)